MRQHLRYTVLALALGIGSFAALPAMAAPSRTADWPQERRMDVRDAHDATDRIDARLRDIDRERGELDQREQQLRGELQSINYNNTWNRARYDNPDRDRMRLEFDRIQQRENALNAERSTLLAQRANDHAYERHDDRDRDGR